MKLNRYKDAANAFQEAIEAAMTQLDDEAKLKPFVTEVEKHLKVSTAKLAGSDTCNTDLFKDDSKLPMLTGANPQMPAFSKVIEMLYSPKVCVDLAD